MERQWDMAFDYDLPEDGDVLMVPVAYDDSNLYACYDGTNKLCYCDDVVSAVCCGGSTAPAKVQVTISGISLCSGCYNDGARSGNAQGNAPDPNNTFQLDITGNTPTYCRWEYFGSLDWQFGSYLNTTCSGSESFLDDYGLYLKVQIASGTVSVAVGIHNGTNSHENLTGSASRDSSCVNKTGITLSGSGCGFGYNATFGLYLPTPYGSSGSVDVSDV